jgi:hypothetical protein
MKKYFTIVFSALFIVLNAQKEDYVWFLGQDQSPNPGVQGMIWNWNTEYAKPKIHDIAYGISSSNASVSDKDGNLLFWSNGCAVINREQEVMPNGDTLNWDPFREIFGFENCQRGLPGTQNIKILSDPANESGFYIFHKAKRYFGQFEDITTDLRISYVDMTLAGGMGDVIYFDSILYDAPVISHHLEAINTSNGDDWWILQPVEGDSLFLTYKVDENGIERMLDQNSSVLFAINRAGAGTMRMSPDGERLAYYDYFLNLHVYDFDRESGKISNHEKVTIFDDAEEKPNNQFRFGSIEWSPNSRFMYVAVSDSLFQVDSWEENMDNGIRLIDIYDGTQNPFATTFYVASLAPDCKIYICSTSGNKSYHIIHRPDELGTACNFVQNGLQLPASAGSANLPLFPRFRVDEEDKCDSTITSIFGDAVFFRKDLKVHPSPSDGRYIVEIPENFSNGTMAVLNPEGQVIYQKDIVNNTLKIDVNITNYPSGLYFIELYPNNNRDRIFWSKQVMKR